MVRMISDQELTFSYEKQEMSYLKTMWLLVVGLFSWMLVSLLDVFMRE